MELSEAILQLCALSGPSGYEGEAADFAVSLLRPHMDEVSCDVMGNIIGVKRCGKPNARKLMIDAHIDEIGFVITGYEEGFLKFSSLGSVDARMLPSSEIKILTQPPIYGVVDALPPHILKADEMESTIKIEDLVIDIGMEQDAAMAAVPLGTSAVYNTQPRMLGDGQICAKALDDRACFAAIVKALKLVGDKPLPMDVYVTASTQEEVGTRGAGPAAYSIKPDYAIIVDVGHAATPDCKSTETCPSGGGVIISVGPNMNRAFTARARQLAEQREIKHSISVEPTGNSGTNARVIQVSREGIATCLLGIPLKYMHTPNEVISLSDAEATARLIAELILSPEVAE